MGDLAGRKPLVCWESSGSFRLVAAMKLVNIDEEMLKIPSRSRVCWKYSHDFLSGLRNFLAVPARRPAPADISGLLYTRKGPLGDETWETDVVEERSVGH